MRREEKRYVYKFTYTPTGKIYVGQTWNLEQRIKTHTELLKYGLHKNKELQEDFNKYGGELLFEVLEEVPTRSEHLTTAYELWWMVELGSYLPEIGYNNHDPALRKRNSREYTDRVKEYIEKKNARTYGNR